MYSVVMDLSFYGLNYASVNWLHPLWLNIQLRYINMWYLFYSVQTIVGGTIAEVEDMLNKYGDSYDSRKSLATFVAVLKR